MRMQTCRRTELLQMLGVTTIGSHSHIGSQALGEDRHRLFTCSCGISSQMVCKATFNLSVILCFGWSLCYFSSMVLQMWQSSGAWRPLSLLCEPVRIQSVLHDARTLRKVGCHSWNSIIFVIFWCISTKLGYKVYIWWFDSQVKFHAKNCTRC